MGCSGNMLAMPRIAPGEMLFHVLNRGVGRMRLFPQREGLPSVLPRRGGNPVRRADPCLCVLLDAESLEEEKASELFNK
jgi:hypothetical protein